MREEERGTLEGIYVKMVGAWREGKVVEEIPGDVSKVLGEEFYLKFDRSKQKVEDLISSLLSGFIFYV